MTKQAIRLVTAVVLAFVPTIGFASDNGLITVESKNSVALTIERFEEAVRAEGWMVFTRIDHAAAAETHGLKLLPRTVIIYGNPRVGTGNMVTMPTVAIDIPPKALVWQDDQGKVWLSYNSAAYLHRYVYPRHGVPSPPPEVTEGYAQILKAWAEKATQ